MHMNIDRYYFSACVFFIALLVAPVDQISEASPIGTSGGDKFQMKIKEFKIHNESIISSLVKLGRMGGFLINIENYRSNTGDFFNGVKVSLDIKDVTIEEILKKIQESSDAFKLIRDGNIVNIIAKPLVHADNPFDDTVDAVKFRGTAKEFVFKMGTLDPNLMPIYLDTNRLGGNEEVYEIEIKSKRTVRQVFNAFAASSQMRWYAEVRDKPKSSQVMGRTIVQFFKNSLE